jgi:predicted transposase YdaD
MKMKVKNMVNNVSEVKLKFSLKEVITAVQELNREEKEFFIENLIAATSPEYLESIKEAREDYRKHRVISHKELFAKES